MAETTSPTFPHAVASFEPTSTGVLLWTRLGGGATEAELVHRARTRSMHDVVASGRASTSPDADHTITVVDVDGLSPATTYWYRFDAGGERSPVGRTRTLPGDGADGVPARDRVLRRLLGGAARRVPRPRRARGRPRAPPRRLHLRGRRRAGGPSCTTRRTRRPRSTTTGAASPRSAPIPTRRPCTSATR